MGASAFCRHGRGDLLAGVLALQDLADGGAAGLLGRAAVAVAVFILQAEHVMGQAAHALGVHGPAALAGAGVERLDGLGDRQRPGRLRRLSLPQQLGERRPSSPPAYPTRKPAGIAWVSVSRTGWGGAGRRSASASRRSATAPARRRRASHWVTHRSPPGRSAAVVGRCGGRASRAPVGQHLPQRAAAQVLGVGVLGPGDRQPGPCGAAVRQLVHEGHAGHHRQLAQQPGPPADGQAVQVGDQVGAEPLLATEVLGSGGSAGIGNHLPCLRLPA